MSRECLDARYELEVGLTKTQIFIHKIPWVCLPLA